MTKFLFLTLICALSAFNTPQQTGSYLFVVLNPIPACEGKCNNFEVLEFPEKTAEACKKREDSCRAKYGDKATYCTVAPGEALVFYKYNKFVSYCDCKIFGVHKSTSVAAATEEMNRKVAEERLKKPKAFHNFEIYKTWGK